MDTMAVKDDIYEIADSTDWLATPIPSLSAVDSALRCQVCKDFYTTPMLTSCSHTFCSLCIRRCLQSDHKCPTCRADDQEMRLRKNGAMEELVEAFQRARPEVLEFAKKPPAVVQRSISPKRKRESVDDNSSPIKKRTRAGRKATASQASQSVVLDSEEDNDEYVPESKPEVGLIPCPMCQEEFTVEAIQPHAATCDGTPPTRKRPLIPQITKPMSLNPSKRPDRLPHPHFSGLKDTALRKKMSEQGISTAGSRQLMEKRYIEWVTLWNADCDSNHPKGRGALKRELDIWERTQGGRAVVGGREYAAGREIRDKDFDREAWGKSNGDDFKKLIADARRKAKAKNEEGSGERPTLAGSNSGTPQERPDIEISGGGRGPLEPLPPGFSPPQASLPPTFTQPRVEDSPTKYAMPALYREPTGEPSMAPPSSQYQPSSYQPSSSLNKDTSLNSSDISPMRSLQP